MEIQLQSTGAVVTENEFRATHPNTSFPATLTLEIVREFGGETVLEAPAPAYDAATQTAYRNGVTRDALGNLVQAWAVRSLTVEEIDARKPTREQLKQQRQAAVDAITVTVNGKVFDGDETSQERMSRALRVADITGQTSCTWVLHDNTATTVTKDELSQALALAMQAQAAIWVIA